MKHPIQNPGRRIVLARTLAGVCAAVAIPRADAAAQTSQPQPTPIIPKRPDPLEPSLVNEFVRKAHVDLLATKAFLAE